MSRLIGCALQETAPLWPDIKRAFGWVHRAAHILNNTEALPAPTVARRLDGLCGALCRHRACAGDLADGVDHFLKVTRSYRPGLFHCHAVADLPGTNNGLEGLFGLTATASGALPADARLPRRPWCVARPAWSPR